jgi:hypothetical protein
MNTHYATGSPQSLAHKTIFVATLMIALLFCFNRTASGQNPSASLPNAPQPSYAGSVPSGPASDEVLKLSLRDAIARALRYDLDALEGGQNARIARGQQSEQSLASADDQDITSLYDHNLAKLSLARALGVARTGYNQYLGGQ